MKMFQGFDAIYEETPAWKDLPWIRDHWDGPLVLKGILTVEDAKKAVAEGVDAIVISNHGGNVLDGSIPTLPVLPDIEYVRSEEHTSELQSRGHIVCRLLLEKKINKLTMCTTIPSKEQN